MNKYAYTRLREGRMWLTLEQVAERLDPIVTIEARGGRVPGRVGDLGCDVRHWAARLQALERVVVEARSIQQVSPVGLYPLLDAALAALDALDGGTR